MIDDELAARVMQLYQVENLSMRQIAAYCGMCNKTVSRIFKSSDVKPYYGRLVENIAYTDSDVVQYGFGFAVSIV